jgi:flavorubredoxin
MSYPTEREVIRELIDTSHNAFEQGYAAGRQDIIDKIKTILSAHNDRDACRELACLVIREGAADV